MVSGRPLKRWTLWLRACQRSRTAIALIRALPTIFAMDCASPAWADACLPSPTHIVTAQSSMVSARGIISLRDFGPLNGFPLEPSAAVSPDGHQAALLVRQADPDRNVYCTGIVIVDLDRRRSARTIAYGGEVVRTALVKYGIAGVMGGGPDPGSLRWSPDGRWIAWAKDEDGRHLIWRVHPDGTGGERIHVSPVPVTGLAWTADSKAVVFASQPALVDIDRRVEREGLVGYRYDGRFWALDSMRPYPSASTSSVIQRIDLANGSAGSASAASPLDALLLDPQRGSDWPSDADVHTASSDGLFRAWTSPLYPHAFVGPLSLHIAEGGIERPCNGPQCQDIVGLWWTRGDELLVLRRSGVARSGVTLFRWTIGHRRARRLIDTDDMLFGCQMDRDRLLCTHEGSTQPHELVAVDPASGRMTTLYDPNPEWKGVRHGTVQRLSWTNDFGIETFGDLILPADATPGQRLPLVIVQYDSRGFLRGGIADDYPVQLFAAHGFAVLSFNRPPYYALRHGVRSNDAFFQLNQQDWHDRRSYQSSLEHIVRILTVRGVIDPAKIGITGVSDGASAVTFGLIHSTMFAAAAISTCCEDENILSEIGPGFADTYHGYGYPMASQAAPIFWSESALDRHADHHPIPLLIQAGDHEARMALSTYATLKGAGWPIEMYVFPDEAHVKYWPAHRLAVYDRSVAWFEHWLMGKPFQHAASSAAALPADHAQPAAQASTSTK